VDPAAAYSAIPYPGDAFLRTHPRHVAAVAQLHGLRLQPADNWRVLELGCADAGNALAIAASLPAAQVTAIDIDAAAIARGSELAARAGLTNITLHAADVTALDSAALGRFELVIVHGLLSWVPDAVRRQALTLTRDCMTERGVAFVSFNCGPVRRALRRRLLPRLAGIADPHERLAAARELLGGDLIAGGDPDVLAHVRYLRGLPDHLLAHDDLGAINTALALDDVLGESGLRYLGDATLAAGSGAAASHRQVLLTRARPASVAPDPLRLGGLHAGAALQRQGDTFTTPDGLQVHSGDQAQLTALDALAGAWPEAVAVDTLPRDSWAVLLEAAAHGLVRLVSPPPTVSAQPSACPRALALARAQAARDARAVSQWHRTIGLDADDVALLTQLDATHAVNRDDPVLLRLAAAALVVA
jgi:hypothetical protein